MHQVSLDAIRLRAGKIASKTGSDRTTVTQALIKAHTDLGIEVVQSTDNDTDLNFAGQEKPDFSKTQPYQRPRHEQPLKL